MNTDIAEIVASGPLFAGMRGEEVEAVLAHAVEKRLRARQVLFREGEPAAALHLVVAGRIKMSQLAAGGQEVIVRIVGAGDMLAAVAAFSDLEYPATARAVEASRVLLWPRDALRDLLLRVPRLTYNALGVLSGRVRELQDRFREVATERVAQRIARALLRLVAQAGRRVDEGVLIDLPLSRQDLAEMTGTTLFTVSRVLTAWESRGLVRVGRQRVVISRPHGLVAVAEDLP